MAMCQSHRMSLSGIWPFDCLRHAGLSICRCCLGDFLEVLVERYRIRLRLQIALGLEIIPQVVDGHPGTDDDDVLIAQRLHRLPQLVVHIGVFIMIYADLHQRDVQGILLGVERWVTVRGLSGSRRTDRTHPRGTQPTLHDLSLGLRLCSLCRPRSGDQESWTPVQGFLC